MLFFRSIATVGLFTIFSRLLGFLRDLLTAIYLGAGPIADAFVVAQRLPNAFRFLFAESATDSAFVPIYIRNRRQNDSISATAFARQALTILLLGLLPLVVFGIIFMPTIVALLAPGFRHDPLRFHLTVVYSEITFGYLLLVSLTALAGGVLNAERRFGPFAAAPALLNFILIVGLFIPAWFGFDIALWGSYALMVGGAAQVALLYYFCRRAGIHLYPVRPQLTADVRQFFRLVGPGVIGAGAPQINIVVSTVLASSLPSGAVAALYYADRLNQLPLGVIGIAIATALLPVLTHHIAAREKPEAIHYFSRSIELALAFSLPIMLILILAANQIVRILFLHGAFNADNARITAQALMGYAPAVPASILVRILSICFFAHEDTRTPVLVAILAVATNIIAGLMLTPLFAHVGIAIAFALASWVNAMLLGGLLFKRGHFSFDAEARRRLPRLLLTALVMGVVLFAGRTPIERMAASLLTASHPFFEDIAAFAAMLVLGGGVYLVMMHLTGALQLSEIRNLLKASQQDDAAPAIPATPAAAPETAETELPPVLAPTIFHEPWWLYAATRGRYQLAEVRENGRVVGRLPYLLSNRFGLRYSVMPDLTHFLGPAVDEGPGGAVSRFLRRIEITEQLIDQLPPTGLFRIKCHRGIADAIAFQEKRFLTSIQFTCEIAPQPADTIWKNMRDKTRNVIRRAQENHLIAPLEDPLEYIDFYRRNLDERQKSSNFGLDMAEELIGACLTRNRGRIWSARAKDGTLAAAIFCVWDRESSYYLMATRAGSSGNGAGSALVWEAIKDAASRGLIFDFDGISSKGAVLFFAGFGGKTAPRYVVTRSNLAGRVATELRSLLHEGSWFHQ